MLVVGVELAISTPKFDELLEGRQPGALSAELCRLLDRTREVVELDEIARHIARAGDHAANALLDDAADLIFPVAQEGFGRRDDEFAGIHLHRQDAETCRVGARHDVGYCREVDLQRIDVVVLEADARRQPLADIVEQQGTMRRQERLPLLLADKNQWMDQLPPQSTFGNQRIGICLFDETVGNH